MIFLVSATDLYMGLFIFVFFFSDCVKLICFRPYIEHSIVNYITHNGIHTSELINFVKLLLKQNALQLLFRLNANITVNYNFRVKNRQITV